MKQREVLAQFYSNLALAWLSFGVVAPVFTGVDFTIAFVIRLSISILCSGGLLYFSLQFFR